METLVCPADIGAEAKRLRGVGPIGIYSLKKSKSVKVLRINIQRSNYSVEYVYVYA